MSDSLDGQLQLAETTRPFPPHWHSAEVLRHISSVTLLAMLPVVAVAITLFGVRALLHIGLTLAGASICELFVCMLARRQGRGPQWDWRNGHTFVLGTVLALTLPPACELHVPLAGGVLMVLCKQLLGGMGHYLWHPALVARAILCFAFPAMMLPAQWPVLKRANVVVGDLSDTETLRANLSWFESPTTNPQSWSGKRPVQILTQMYQKPAVPGRSAVDSALILVRDKLPPTLDCLLGTTGGGLGETCIVAILIGGVLLVYRGYAHWTLPVGAVLGMIIAAAILPLHGSGGQWWPIRLYVPGHPSLPVGMILTGYHLIVGEFIFAIFFVASDMTSSPMRARGHFYYGLAIGLLTIILRYAGFSTGSTYWAILIASALTPAIDRLTRRRVYGT